MGVSADLRIAFVVPAHQAASTLERCLGAILSTRIAPDQVLVVDDGSRDATGEIARRAGARLIRNETPLRPARARNKGVEHIDADIIFFVDADVVVRPDVMSKVQGHFEDSGVTAVIGSYDASPPAVSVVSRYRNLLHHFVHHQSKPDVETFWTGIGAVRKTAFDAVGGLDSNWENIEDVEFGLRLTANGGQTILDPTIQGTHLKEWTLTSMFKTDLWGRAVPWTKLIRSRRMKGSQLNTTGAHMASALCVLGFGVSILAAPLWTPAVFVSALMLLTFVLLNAPFLGVLHREGGWALAIGAVPYHAMHYLAAICGYAIAMLFPNRT